MWKRSKLLLLVAAAAVVAIGLITYFSARSTSEPKYNGHTLSEWLEIRSQSTWGQNPSTTRSNEAAQAILHIGTNGLPLAVEWLRFQPSTNAGGLDSSIERVTFRAPVTSSLKRSIYNALHAHERFSGYAMDDFYLLRADASPAIPALVELAHRTNAPWPVARAIICLGYIGTNALDAMSAMLMDTNYPQRFRVVFSIGNAHRQRIADWHTAGPILLKYIDDPDPPVRRASLLALGTMAWQPDICVPLLTNKLASANSSIRTEAAYILGYYAAQQTNLVSLLQGLLTDSDIDVRRAATNSLDIVRRSKR